MKLVYLFGSNDYADASRLGKAKSAILEVNRRFRYEIISQKLNLNIDHGFYSNSTDALEAAREFLSSYTSSDR